MSSVEGKGYYRLYSGKDSYKRDGIGCNDRFDLRDSKLICTSDKATACVAENISVLVDDHPKNCDAVAAKGVTALLFESKGNQNINTEHCRVKNWKEVLEEIIKFSY